ncbi:Hsp20/alpha crystallin family protein [Flavobacterium croceum]|uniref:HSP20 family protein n=1 Tax=Flavobacterium croceum DSM 17960 TaxID=1121886 RepID=A0A2S4NAP7_9FLAO|nr:Hsp20/alpha crystallin family protein [Flavobacterium croceum]POS02768.1 HSP20 family protein [Flavobacterium croceum DSM 17960]
MNVVKRNTVPFPSIIDEFLKPDWLGGMQTMQATIPAVNIKESTTSFLIELAAPGKSKEDFNVEIDHNMITISSETKQETEIQEGKYTRKEFNYSSFRRVFTLPETVNTDSIHASYENGVLKIDLPKKEEALPKPKRLIEIQ